MSAHWATIFVKFTHMDLTGFLLLLIGGGRATRIDDDNCLLCSIQEDQLGVALLTLDQVMAKERKLKLDFAAAI